MAKVSNYARTRVELLHKQGLLPAEIFRSLKAEGLLVSISSVVRIIKKFKITGFMANLPPSRRQTKTFEGQKAFIDRQMEKDDEKASRMTQNKCHRFVRYISKQTLLFGVAMFFLTVDYTRF